MSARLLARLERLQPRKRESFVVRIAPGDSELDIEMKVLAAGRPVFVLPQRCRTTEEWLLKYCPTGGKA
jgi:hypothetical protein